MNKKRHLIFFDNFFGILQESEYFRGRNEIVNEVKKTEDKFIFHQLNRIKRHKTKFIATEKKKLVAKLDLIFDALKKNDKNGLDNLLGAEYSTQAFALYSNFKKESEVDSKEIEYEHIYLKLLEILENEGNT